MRSRSTAMLGLALLLVLLGVLLYLNRGTPSSAGDGGGPPVVGDGGAGQPPGQGAGASNSYGFKVWHEDFPDAPERPHLSPRNPGKWYDRTRRQALEKVTENLSGNCTKDAWQMAKEFFARVPKDQLDVLVEHLDRALQVPHQADLVENILDAMGRAAQPSLAEAALRALDHQKASVRTKAIEVLIRSGTADAIQRAQYAFDTLETRGQASWITAARANLGADVVPVFQAILMNPRYTPVHRKVVEQALTLPPAQALEALAPLGGNPPPELQPTFAGLRHAAGDGAGTALLSEMLSHEAPQVRAAAVRALRAGGIETFENDLCRMVSRDPDGEVRLAAIEVLGAATGDAVADALETVAVTDEVLDVRQAALAQLRVRGRRDLLDDLIEVVRTATGSKLRFALADLIAARDGGAVPAIAERLAKAPADEKRGFIQALGLTTAPAAFSALRDAFLSAEPGIRENLDYIAYMMRNCRGAEGEMLALFAELPHADYVRRAHMMVTLANVAADREDEALAASVAALLRRVLMDEAEIPQMRLLALEYLRRDLQLDDLFAIKKRLEAEQPPMRAALADFLFEFF